MKDSIVALFISLMACWFIVMWNSSDIENLKRQNDELKTALDKRITGNALMSDQAWNEAQKASGMAEENEQKIREVLERCKCQK